MALDLNSAVSGASAGSAFGPWGAAIGAGVGLLGGMLGSRSSKKAAEQQRQATMAYGNTLNTIGQNVEQGWGQYGQNLTGLAGDLRSSYGFSPISARSPFASVSLNNGMMEVNGSPETQQMMGLGSQYLNEAGMFDRAGAQGAYFQNLMGMAAPARALQTQGLLRQLQAKGMAGLGSNVNGNMLMKGMAEGWANQDLAASKMAMDYGGSELDRLLARGTGMFTNAANLTNQAVNQWQTGQAAVQPFQAMMYGFEGQAARAPLEGMLARAGYQGDAARIMAGGDINSAAARNAANTGMIRGATGALQGLPWEAFLGKMFGNGGAPSNYGTIDPAMAQTMYPGAQGVW